MMLKLLAKEVHQNAVEHGFYDGGEPPFTEILADCHSELSEAREEHRAGNPVEYKREDGKPCGVAVEMVDCMLRILDWFGNNGLDVDRILIEKHAYNRIRPYLHGKQPVDKEKLQALKDSARKWAEEANGTLGKIEDETGEKLVYRKYQPFNPVPLTETVPQVEHTLTWEQAYNACIDGKKVYYGRMDDRDSGIGTSWISVPEVVRSKWFVTMDKQGYIFKQA